MWKEKAVGKQIDEEQDEFERLFAKLTAKESAAAEVVELPDKRKLGIATLGYLEQHPRISSLCQLIEGWHLSEFTPEAARSLPLAGPQKHLNARGDNLGNVIQFMKQDPKSPFGRTFAQIVKRIPGIHRMAAEETRDGRLLLKLDRLSFHEMPYGQQAFDGTLRLFAYFLLLSYPTPPLFIGIDAPENGLYYERIKALAEKFREHATGRKGESQVFVTTQQPDFANVLPPEDVWILEKGEDGFSTVRRASEDPLIQGEAAKGSLRDALWYSKYLEAR